MKNQYISQLKAGDSVDDVFVLSEKSLAQKKDGSPYLNVTLSDKTGSIRGVVWDRVDQIASKAAAGDYVHVKAGASEYRQNVQLVIKHMSACETGGFDPTDFMPATARNVDAMFERLLKLTETVKTDCLRKLLEVFLQDADFVENFKKAPAAKRMHHAYLGGLLEHSLSTALLAEKTAGHYSGIDRDLLVTGAILHDIGKIREFDYKLAIEYSDAGKLLSHIVIGVQMVDEKIRQIEQFPQETALLLEHMMISHHGTRDFGSPEPPKTIEAVLLNFIDDIDAKVNGIREFMDAESANDVWTSYHSAFGRYFYMGRAKGD